MAFFFDGAFFHVFSLLLVDLKVPILPVSVLKEGSTYKDFLRIFAFLNLKYVFVLSGKDAIEQFNLEVGQFQSVFSRRGALEFVVESTIPFNINYSSTQNDFVYGSELLVSVLRFMSLKQINIVAVFDLEGKYLGELETNSIVVANFSSLLQQVSAHCTKSIMISNKANSVECLKHIIESESQTNYISVVDEHQKFLNFVAIKDLLTQFSQRE